MYKPTDVVRAVLSVLNYTPKRLAADIDVTYSQARRILRAGGNIYPDELDKICEKTGLSQSAIYANRGVRYDIPLDVWAQLMVTARDIKTCRNLQEAVGI